MVTIAKIRKPEFLIVTEHSGAEINIRITQSTRLQTSVLHEMRSVTLFPIRLFYVQGTYPRIQIHSADKIVGDKAYASENFLFRVEQQIPLRKGRYSGNRVLDAVLVNRPCLL